MANTNFDLTNEEILNGVSFNFGDGDTPTPSADASNSTVAFTQASTRTNISTGEKLSVICGKIKKFFADLKTVAFSGDYNDLSNKPTIPNVNNATLTIKQGSTTKGTFTANASENVEIDLDAGGGGSTYTAGDGIDITNNVISVINPITKTQINFDDAVIPCLFVNTSSVDQTTLTKEDGTDATLSDCLDLGASTLNISKQFLKHWEDVAFSGDCKVYDYGTQQQTTEQYSGSVTDGTTQVYISSFNLFDECVQIVQGTVPTGTTMMSLQIMIGKANGHLYAFLLNQYWGTLSEQNYFTTCSLDGDFEFTQI